MFRFDVDALAAVVKIPVVEHVTFREDAAEEGASLVIGAVGLEFWEPCWCRRGRDPVEESATCYSQALTVGI